MKCLLGCIVGIFLLQGTIAEPLFFDVIGNIGSNIAKGISDAAAGISENVPSSRSDDNPFSIPGFFGNAIKGAIDVAGGFGQIAVQAAGNAVKIGTDTLKSGVDAVTNVGKVVENGVRNAATRYANILKGIARVKISNVRNAINFAKKPISNAQSALQTLNDISQYRLTSSLKRINETIDAQNRLKDWADEQKSRFESASDETREQANQEIDNFIQQREKETQKCSKNVIQPIQKLFNDQRKFEESNLPAVHAVLNEIEKCMGKQLTLTTAGDCARKIRQNVSKILSIPQKAADLKRKFMGTAADEILTAPCIADTRIKIERGKQDLQKKLNDLLTSDSTSTTEVTTGTSDSSTASDDNSTTTSSSDENSTTASPSDESSLSEESTTASSSEESTTVAADSTTVESSSSSSDSTPEESSTQNSSTTESADTSSSEPESTPEETDSSNSDADESTTAEY